MTEDLKARLAVHNAGGSPHTSKFKPWTIETAIAFTSREKAAAFEAYLKTGSGHEFRYRHFKTFLAEFLNNAHKGRNV